MQNIYQLLVCKALHCKMESPIDVDQPVNFTLSVQDLERIALGLAPEDPETPVPKLDLGDLAKTLENIESPALKCPKPQPIEQQERSPEKRRKENESLGSLGIVLVAVIVGGAFLGPLMEWLSNVITTD
ncbi:Hypothetical predicted protein [Cloeon dipterum]|uniref:Uncharacterized protein n=1 Tax=Cloeon dipterum TaxID=197152 RepID=A0A8S1DRT8_9INSE|nr:Hypothetical predicted protein [Cloeon dipterum]